MKRIKILFFAISLIAIGFIINIKYLNNNNLINDSTKEDYYVAKEVLNSTDIVPLSNETSRYKVDFPNGTTKYYNSIGTAVGELVSNSKFTLMMSMNVNYTTPIVIGARGINNITFDLNGYKLTKPNEGADFFHIAAHNVNIISSRPGGAIEATVNDPNSLAIRVLGEQKNWLPKVTIGEGVKVLSNGDSAIINRSGILVIDGATVKSKSFYAIQSYMLGGADRNPQVVVNNDSVVFGIYAGLKNESWYGGDFYFNDGIILPYTSSGANRVFKKGNSSLEANNVYINKISTARLYINDLAFENKHNHDIFPADKTTNIEGGNYYLDEIIRYQTVTYESFGGIRTSTNQAPEPEKHYFDGKGFTFPTDMVYALGTGIKFVGWYSNSDYTAGPFSGRNPYHTEDRTYYARYTYELTYDANIPANDINKAFDSNGNSFTTLTKTENTGSKIYATTPTGLTRPGYTLVGWSSNPDTRPDATSNLFSPGSGVNWFLPQGAEGKRTIYAIWQPDYQVQYHVRYFYENYDGTFTENNNGHSTLLYRTNFPGSGLTNPDGQQPKLISHELSQSPEHISERKVQIKGDGSSVAKVYYTIKRYTVTFDANGGTYKTDGSYDGSGGVYTVLHGQSIGTKSYFEAPYGYEYFGWDFGLGNVYNVTSSFTVKPLWSPKKITYTFDYKIPNQANVEVVQQFDDTLNTPASINRDGILFLGWYRLDNNELFTLTEQIKSLTPLTLYAKWTYEEIVAVDPIKSVEDIKMGFRSDPTYEYALIKSGVSLNTSTAKWFQPKGYNSWYTGLRPNTSYELHMRIKGDESNNLEPSNIVYVTFKTKYLPLDMITDYKNSNNQIIFKPSDNQSYVVKDNEGNILTPILEDGKLVYNTDPTKQYDIFVKSTKIDDNTGEEIEVEILITNESPITYDDFKDNIDLLNNYYDLAIDKINNFPFLTEEEKRTFENDIENAVNNVYQQVLEEALDAKKKSALETIISAAESQLTNAANQVINDVNPEAIKDGFKGLVDDYNGDYSSPAVDALRDTAKDLIESAESILELENILEQYEILISNKINEEITLANEKDIALNKLNNLLNSLNEADYYADDWDSIIFDYNNFLSLIENATLNNIEDIKEDALTTFESYTTKLDYQSLSINELENYLTIKGQNNYSSNNWDEIVSIYNEAITKINNTISSDQLEGIVNNAKYEIDQIKTLLEIAINDALLSLENEKDSALNNLDLLNYLSELEKQEYINNIVDIYTNAVTSIDESNSLGDVTFRLNNATSQIQNNVDLATDKNINNYKNIITTDLSNFINGFVEESYSKNNWQSIQTIYNNSLNEIDNKLDLNVLFNIYTQTKLNILEIKTLEDELNDYKHAAIAEIENHFESFNITNYETSEWIRLNDIYNQALNNINKSELKDTIDSIKLNTIEDMNLVKKSERELMSFYVSEAGSDETGNGTVSNPYKTLERAYSAITEADSFIILLTDVKVNEPSLKVDKKITITSQGGTYSLIRNYDLDSDSKSLIEVTNNAELTLTNLILDGNGSLNNTNSEYSLLNINDNSKLNILMNTTLKNSHSIYTSVIKANCSEITIQNATIKENLGESLIDLVDSSLTIYNTNITDNIINSETKGLINLDINTSLNEIINISGNILFENNGSDYAGDIRINSNVTFEVTNDLNTNLSLNTTNFNYDDILA